MNVKNGRKKATLHYNTLMLQLCYLHCNNGGPASAEHLLINNRTGEREGGRVGRCCLRHGPVRSRTPYGLNGISRLLNPSLHLNHRRVSSVCHCPYLYRYKTESCLFIFLPLGSNLNSQSTRGHRVASI